MANLITIGIILAAWGLLSVGIVVTLIRLYKKVQPGQALIIDTYSKAVTVSFTNRIILPFVQSAVVVDITNRALVIDCSGSDALPLADGALVQVRGTLVLGVARTAQDVLRVVNSLGVQRANDPAALQKLFGAKVIGEMQTVLRKYESVQIDDKSKEIHVEVLRALGPDLGGFRVEDLCIRLQVYAP